MAAPAQTSKASYTRRLVNLEYASWKTFLDVQRPYRWNIRRLRPGRTLDIGCGIGRHLKYLPQGSVGIDHNSHSIAYLKKLGLEGYTPQSFKRSAVARGEKFDSLLLSHVLEHMTPFDGVRLLSSYKRYLKARGKVIICCPQEKGYASDGTHVTFLDAAAIADILERAGFKVVKAYSFPFIRPVGKLFTYNEFVIVGRK